LYLLDSGGGLLFAPPCNVTYKSNNNKTENDPSEDLATVSTTRGCFGEGGVDSLTSFDVLSVVAVEFHALLTLVDGVFVWSHAHVSEFEFTTVVVFHALVTVVGNKSTAREGECPSLRDFLKGEFRGGSANFVLEEGEFHIGAIIGTGGSDVECVVTPGVLVFGLVLAAFGVFVNLEVVIPLHVISLVLKVGLNEGRKSNNDFTVVLTASSGTVRVAFASGAQSEEDSLVFGVTLLIDDGLFNVLTAYHLHGVVGKEGEVHLLLLNTTSGRDNLLCGGSGQGHGVRDGHGGRENGGGNEHHLYSGVCDVKYL
jgi:hypothetical protein